MPQKMYVLKFNTPVLPYAKFPLNQNKYIQDFVTKYEQEKDKITQVIGVHFPENDNSQAIGAIGIAINIMKKDNLLRVESVNTRRFRVIDYLPQTNYCMAQEFEDRSIESQFGQSDHMEGVKLDSKDLLQSDFYELKSLWLSYHKKMNQLLGVLPADLLNKYDLVVKGIDQPSFDIHRDEAGFET